MFDYFKRKATENMKMLLQNNCINNGVTNGLKEKKEKKTCKQLFIVNQKKSLALSLCE